MKCVCQLEKTQEKWKILTYVVMPVSLCPAWKNDNHWVLMDAVVMYFTGLYPPTSFILPNFHFVPNQNIFQGCISGL